MTRPLLHMWSVGVEEQFYIFYPFLFAAIASLGRRRKTVFFLFIASMVITTALAATRIVDSSTLFYLLPFRMGQFMAGAAAFYIVNGWSGRSYLGKRLLIAACSLAGMVAAWFIDMPDVFRLSVLVTLGLFPVFLFDWSRLADNLLFAPLHRIADWSFSIYVLHWPIIVFWTVSGGELDVFGVAVCTLLTISGSILTYYGVEQFFLNKRRQKGSWSNAFKAIVAPVALTATAATAVVAMDGLSFRLGEDLERTYEDYAAQRTEYWDLYKTFSIDPENFSERRTSVAVLGDSFSVDLFNIIYRLPGVEAYSPGNVGLNCRAIIIPKTPEDTEACAQAEAEFDRDYSKTDVIILSNHAASYGLHDALDESGFATIVDRLREQGYSGDIVLVGPRPLYQQAPYELAFQSGSLNDLDTVAAKHMSLSIEGMDLISLDMEAWARDNGITYFPLHTQLCSENRCQVINDDAQIIYFDNSHFSRGAASVLGDALEALIRDGVTPSSTVLIARAALDDNMTDEAIAADTDKLDLARTALLQERDNLATRIVEAYLDENEQGDIGADIRRLWLDSATPKARSLAALLADRLLIRRDDFSARYVGGFAYKGGEHVEQDYLRAAELWDHPSLANDLGLTLELIEVYGNPDKSAYNPDKVAQMRARAIELGHIFPDRQDQP